MLDALLTGSIAFVISWLAIPAIIRVSSEKGLFDLPDSRKLHNRPIASLGGIGIFLGFALASLLTISGKLHPQFQFLYAAVMVVFFLGLKDDILILSASKKFIGQLAATAILVHLGGVRINGMHGVLGIGELPLAASLVLTYITIIVITNAFNLIDGVDGLAGLLGLMSTALFGAYFFIAGELSYALLCVAVAASLLAFLRFNFYPARIFMGDSGSLVLGLLNAVLVVRFIETASGAGAPSVLPITAPAAVGFSILIVPLLDTLRVFSIRIARGRSPFRPDRNHIHHLLLDRGLNHRQVALSCTALNGLFVALAWFSQPAGATLLLAAMCSIFYAIIGWLFYRTPRRTPVVETRAYPQQYVETAPAAPMPSPTKVVALKAEVAVAEH